jgi:hypothetical protein
MFHQSKYPYTYDDKDNRTSQLHIGLNFGTLLCSMPVQLVVEAVEVQVVVVLDWVVG